MQPFQQIFTGGKSVPFWGSVALFFCVITPQLVVGETNYCHDPEANSEWEELNRKYPDDMGIQSIHALRIGLCAKVDRGDLTVERATEIFENMRKALIRTTAERNRREKQLERKNL